MRILAPVFLALLTTGCGPGGIFNFGGGEVGFGNETDADGVQNTDTESAPEGGFSSARSTDIEADCDADATPGMQAEATTEGVAMTHNGHTAHDLAVFEVEWVIDTDLDTVWVEYFDISTDTGVANCAWSLKYTLTGIPAGDWTIDVEGHIAEVVVP